jgi:phosphotriesterase-related protein
MSSDAGSVVTVSGRIPPEDIGITLPHEHIFVDWVGDRYDPPDSAVERRIAERPFAVEDRWFITNNPASHRDNLRLNAYKDAVEEVRRFQRSGGDTVVEVTPKNLGGDPRRVRALAQETGVRMVKGTAFYTRSAHPSRLQEASIADIAAEFESDVKEGIGDSDVRAGIIGEVGITGDRDESSTHEFVHGTEEAVLRAGARAARRTGAPLSVHPPSHRSVEWPTSRRCHQVLDICEEEGLPPNRVILCHRDQSAWIEEDLEHQRALADRGSYIEFDMFGHDAAYHPQFDDAQASDADRVRWVADLVDEGYSDQLLFSHDIYMKMFLTKYGGFGYDHILREVVPTFAELDVDDDTVAAMLVDNPRRILTFERGEA